jgi:hypothetical protein
MKAFDIIKNKGEYFQGSSLHYLIGVDGCGDQVCEVDGSESYCSDCIEKIVSERNEELKKKGYSSFSKVHDCSGDQEFEEIRYSTEYSPEDDDFELCENCGAEIDVGVLFTFSQEIDHWIGEISDNLFDIDVISDQDAYRIYTCLTSLDALEKHPNKVQKLRNLIDNIQI